MSQWANFGILLETKEMHSMQEKAPLLNDNFQNFHGGGEVLSPEPLFRRGRPPPEPVPAADCYFYLRIDIFFVVP